MYLLFVFLFQFQAFVYVNTYLGYTREGIKPRAIVRLKKREESKPNQVEQKTKKSNDIKLSGKETFHSSHVAISDHIYDLPSSLIFASLFFPSSSSSSSAHDLRWLMKFMSVLWLSNYYFFILQTLWIAWHSVDSWK